MTREREAVIERLLQHAADELWTELPGRPVITAAHGKIRCGYEGWSSVLFRHWIEFERHIDDACYRAGVDAEDGDWAEMAFLVMHKLLASRIASQRECHARARALGLVVNDICRSLPYSSWLIDRSLLRLLDGTGFEIKAAALAIATGPSDHLTCNGGEIWLTWRDTLVIVASGTDGTPVISTPMPIGRALFDDRIIELPDILPDVIMDAAPGRRLGEIVATGIAHLDDRTIEEIVRYQGNFGGWRQDSKTEIRLMPDYVPLGCH